MATLTVKNLPDTLYVNLKRKAQLHHRSINSEVIVCLERALGATKKNTAKILKAAELSRKRAANVFVTDKELKEIIGRGRK